MTPKPAHSLEQHVDGAKTGNKKIGVYIQGLFQYLGSNKDASLLPPQFSAFRSVEPYPFSFISLPVGLSKAGMEQTGVRTTVTSSVRKFLVQGLGFIYHVFDPEYLLPLFRPLQGFFNRAAWMLFFISGQSASK
jgi:hypothetical protein